MQFYLIISIGFLAFGTSTLAMPSASVASVASVAAVASVAVVASVASVAAHPAITVATVSFSSTNTPDTTVATVSSSSTNKPVITVATVTSSSTNTPFSQTTMQTITISEPVPAATSPADGFGQVAGAGDILSYTAYCNGGVTAYECSRLYQPFYCNRDGRLMSGGGLYGPCGPYACYCQPHFCC